MEKLVCKLCKRDLQFCAAAFRDTAELKHAHTVAHLQDVVRDMKVVCRHVAVVGWADHEMAVLAQKVLGEIEIIDGGLF